MVQIGEILAIFCSLTTGQVTTIPDSTCMVVEVPAVTTLVVAEPAGVLLELELSKVRIPRTESSGAHRFKIGDEAYV